MGDWIDSTELACNSCCKGSNYFSKIFKNEFVAFKDDLTNLEISVEARISIF